jgi:hypothetical protein
MDYQGRSDLKEILVKLYGDAVAGRWEPNEKLYFVLVDFIEASSECSNALAMVPGPLPIGGSVTRWLSHSVA